MSLETEQILNDIRKLLCVHRNLVSAILIGSTAQKHTLKDSNIDVDVILIFKEITPSILKSILEIEKTLVNKYQTNDVSVIVNTTEVTMLRPFLPKGKHCLLYIHLTPLSLREFEGLPTHVKFSMKYGRVLCGSATLLSNLAMPSVNDIIHGSYGIEEFIRQITTREVLIGKRVKGMESGLFSLVFDKRKLRGNDYLYYIIYALLKASWNTLCLRFPECWRMPEDEMYSLFQREFGDVPNLNVIGQVLTIKDKLLNEEIVLSQSEVINLAETTVKFLKALCKHLQT